MALLERLAILITADAAGAVNEMKKVADSAQKDLGKAGAEGQNLSGQMTKVGAGMVAAGAGLLAVGVSAASTTTDLGREVIKLQRYTGMTAEEASKLSFAAKNSGVPVDSLTVGLGKLSKQMEANSPVFEKLGVDARDSDGKLRSMGDLLPDLAEKFKNMPNGPEKTALALQLFGRNGMDLMPFLNKGKEGIEALSKEAEKMGLVLSQDNIGQIKAHIQSQRDLSAAFDGMKTQIGLTIMPLLDGFTNAFKDMPGPIKDVIGPITVFGGGALVAMGSIGLLVGQLQNLAPAVSGLIGWFSALSPMTMVIVGVGVALAAVAALIAVFGDNNKKDQQSIDNFTEALKQQGAAFDAAAAKAVASKIESKGFTETMRNAGVDMGNYKQAVLDGGTAVKNFAELMKFGHTAKQQADAMSKLTEAQRNYAQSVLDAETRGDIDYKKRQKLLMLLADMNGEYDTAKTSVDNLATSTEAMTPKGTALAIAEQAAADATSHHSEAAKALNDALHAALDPFFGMISAANQNEKAQADAAAASDKVRTAYTDLQKALASGNEKDIAEKTKALTDAQNGYKDAQKAATDSALGYETTLTTLKAELEDNKITVGEAITKIDEMKDKHLISAETAEYFKGKIKELGTAIGAIPPAVNTKFNMDTWQAAQNIEDLVTRVQKLNTLAHSPTAYNFGSLGSAMGGRIGPGMAIGGRTSSPHLVGELGPEIFWPDSAGTIVTAEKTKQMLSSSGGGNTAVYNINVNVSTTADKAAVGQSIVEAIAAYERRSGDGWRAA